MLSADQVQAAIAAIESGDAEAMKAVLTDILAAMASGEEAPEEPSEPTDDAAANAADPPPSEEDDEPEASAVVRSLQETVNSLLAEKEARELEDRRGLIAKLVELGVETPATAWSGKPEDRMPCKRLASEPVAEMRSRVEAMASVRQPAPVPPSSDTDVSKLSPKILAECKKRGITPEEFVVRKAAAVRTRQPRGSNQ